MITADFKKVQEVSAEAQDFLHKALDRELHFTRVYAENEGRHPYELERLCLQAQFPAQLAPLQDDDWFAGRYDRMLVGLDPEEGWLLALGYYCRFEVLQQMLKAPGLAPVQREQIEYLIDFWTPRQFYRQCREQFPPDVKDGIPSDDYYSARDISYPMYGLGGPVLDYHKLVVQGIEGLRQEVRARQAGAGTGTATADQTRFFQSLLTALDIFTDCARWYARQVQAKAATAARADDQKRFERMARDLEQVAERPPQSFAQAIQLVWLYSIVAMPKNYGRLDVTLGDFLAADLDSGRLSWAEARDLTVGLWKLMLIRGNPFNNRVIVGGRGRPNAPQADRFARLAMEAQAIVNGPIPQLTLRWHEGMDPHLWDLALDVIGKGSTHPMLYNDDINVPAVEKAFGVSRAEAEQYVPYGCGEYILEHRSIGSPDAAINVAKVLEVTLFNGRDALTGEARGLATGAFRSCHNFAEFQQAFDRQLEHEVAMLADAQATIYRFTGARFQFPFLSLLHDDCLARAKPLLAGGVRYAGGTMESFGNTTAGDSLLAIRKAVFEEQQITADELLAGLRDDFRGHERQRALLKALPKYGNDHAEADAMTVWLNQRECALAIQHGRRVGLDSFLVVLVNNGDHVLFGQGTAATPDGRKAREPLSNGNQPSAGSDTHGLTALLKSMAKLDPGLHAGATHNLKISRTMLQRNRAQISALLKGYFADGGTQAMITVTDRGELEDAIQHPEKHADLVVRVGGYSARFVDLSRDLQLDILNRTLY